jgi:hypothetical protein
MSRKALLIGIDHYHTFRHLGGCVADAISMGELLADNEDGSTNYDCRVLTSAGATEITRATLRTEWGNLFQHFDGDALFYFSGHGSPSDTGGVLCTWDGTAVEPGLPMSDLIQLANQSSAREVLIVLDCCFAGDIGSVPYAQWPGGSPFVQLRQGITIISAAGSTEYAKEEGGHGIFTSLMLQALAGGAADPRGRVSAAAAYAYVEQVLGPWDQRPLYKSYANVLGPVRRCKPQVIDAEIKKLPSLFHLPETLYQMDPTYEHTHDSADPEHVEVFNLFKRYRNAGMLRTVDGDDLFFTAMKSSQVELTPRGKFYWWLASKKRI